MDSVPASEERMNDHAGRPTMTSAALFQGGKEIVIRHGSEEYRLRITRAGKLILTK